jgi:pSer/pThr/pTyr-binding forkhead associated (FHA) protein/Mg-chelatase subunit ChlD
MVLRGKMFIVFSILFFFIQPQSVDGQVRGTDTSEQDQKSRQPLDMVLVLDNSGSMKKNDPHFLTREVVTQFVAGFEEKCRIAMVIFDQKVELVESFMETDDPDDRARFLKSLSKVNYKGQFSNIPGAIERAIYEIKTRGRREAQKIIIFMTDGLVDTGDKEHDLEREKWLKQDLAKESKNQGIRIFSIAFANTADFSLIQTLALKTDGEYFRAYGPDDIQNVFERISKAIAGLPKKSDSLTPRGVQPVTTVILEKKEEKTKPATVQAVDPPPITIEMEGPSSKDEPPAPKDDIISHLILAGIVILLGVTIIIMVLIIKSRSLTKERLVIKSLSMPSADLIDVENVTGNKTLALNKRITKIGRNPDNDIVIARDTVSGFHAIIEYRDDFFYLEDQRSINKTYLNEDEIGSHSPKRLKSGDEIMFDTYKFLFILPDQIPSGATVIHFDEESDTMIYDGADSVIRKPIRQDGLAVQKAMLVDVKSITKEKSIILEKKVTKIGRGIKNDITIPKETVSGFHATIECRDEFYYLEDQRSRNKTFLNGKAIEPNSPVKLKSGDEIMFDGCEFVFLLEDQFPSGETDERP